MKRCLLTLVLLLSTGAWAAGAPLAIRFAVEDSSTTPFVQPQLRLLPVPTGIHVPQVRLVPADGAGAGLPPVEAKALAPMVLRGVSVLPVVLSAAAEKSGALLPHTLNLEVSFEAAGKALPAAVEQRAQLYGRGFYQALGNLLAPGTLLPDSARRDGGYLIITASAFREAADSLAAWKTRKGLPVTVLTVEQAGGTKEAIRQTISDLYHEAAVPTEYVVLIGDVEFLPTFGLAGAVSDHPYAMVDGDDFLPDLFVGRLSVATPAQAQTVVAKIIRYEREPYLANGGAWMGQGLMVGNHSHASTAIPVCDWCRGRLLACGYSQVKTGYTNSIPPGASPILAAAINGGVSIVGYRGWADAERGWDQQFDTDDVHALHNGQALPLVLSFVCANNKFDSAECFGEAWLRAGTPTVPAGGIGFVGNSESWSHTRYNDGIAIGAFDGIGNLGLRQLGQILLSAKAHMLAEWPDELDFATHQEESVEFYFYIYNLLGDPELDVWSGAPRRFSVEAPAELALEANACSAVVRDSADGSPLTGVLVGLVQGERLLAGGRTDGEGRVDLVLASPLSSQPVRMTVTGRNGLPVQQLIPVAPAPAPAVFQEIAILDDGSGQSRGNGDHRANPGETLELYLTVHNQGSAPVTGVQSALQALGADEVLAGTASFAAIPAGGSMQATDPLVVRIPQTAEDGSISRFRLRTAAAGDTSTSEIRLEVSAPALQTDSWTLAGGEGILPGETRSLQVRLQNHGSAGAPALQAVLRSLDRRLMTVIDSTSAYAALPAGAGETGAAGFTVAVPADAVVGQAAGFELLLSSGDGWQTTVSVAVPVGTAAINCPLGPDRYGYWATDSADTDYPGTFPAYDWVECSPLYGGSGARQTIVDNSTVIVTLPFDFPYYGTTYRQLAVSDNGWVAFDLDPTYDGYNWNLPSSYGAGARIAPFWDALVADREVGSSVVFDGVYTWYDAGRHAYVVEWSRLKNRDQAPPPPPEPQIRVTFDALQTFEVLLYDPAYHPESSDGVIDFQYKQVFNVDKNRMYSTVGIENAEKDDALVYTYTNLYPPQAAPLSAGLAIRFSTLRPRYVPFTLSDFSASAEENGVLLRWTPVDARPRQGYRILRAEAGGDYRPVSGTPLAGAARSFLDRGADPSRACLYKVVSVDPAGRETEHGPYAFEAQGYQLSGPTALSLHGANPVRTAALLDLRTSRSGAVLLQILDVTGRTIRTLERRPLPAGFLSVAWDGRDERGNPAPAGIYFARLTAGEDERRVKFAWVR